MRRVARSLQARLLILTLGAVIVVWGAVVAATWRDARHELDELLDGHLAQAAALLVVQQMSDFDEEAPRNGAPALHRYAPKVAFQIFHEGQLVHRSSNAPTRALLTSFHPGFETVRIDGISWRVFATQHPRTGVQVYVGEQTASRESIFEAVLRSLLWPMALALPALGLAVWAAVRWGMGPLLTLRQQLNERHPQALQAVAVDGLPIEMVPLVESLNALFGRVTRLMESERRFTADAAHELRTPIAAIRAQAQVAQGAASGEARREALDNTLAGCDRASRLIDQLLILSRLDSGDVPPTQRLDMGLLVQGVMADLAPQALAKRQQLSFDAEPGLHIMGNDVLLAVLARNLVDNAIRYSPASARVSVTLRHRGADVELDVQDSGPGLTAAQQQRLGERFFRVPGSEQSGSGLGWSIVRRIAALHQGRVRVTDADAGGLNVTVLLPAA